MLVVKITAFLVNCLQKLFILHLLKIISDIEGYKYENVLGTTHLIMI